MHGNFPIPASRTALRIALAGSVDDGKSTLIGRLLYDAGLLTSDQKAALDGARRLPGGGVDLAAVTDGLTDEREQGITIDVAYRYADLGGRRVVFADVPGHEQYTRNMVTGTSTADAAILLIDAERGATRQTWRHLVLALLMGVPEIVVAVNKMDRVGFDRRRFEELRDAATARAAGFPATRLAVLPVAALGGDNVARPSPAMPWYGGPTLLGHLESLGGAAADAGPLRLPVRLPVRYVSRPAPGAPRAYLGRLESGGLRPGDEVVVMPSGRRARVRGLRVLGAPAASAAAGQSVAVELDRDIDVARGDVLAAPDDAPDALSVIEAVAFWFSTTPLDAAGRYLLRNRHRTVRARVVDTVAAIDVTAPGLRPPDAPVGENDIALVALRLEAPVACDPYRRSRAGGGFLLIDETTHETVAAGLIGADALPQTWGDLAPLPS